MKASEYKIDKSGFTFANKDKFLHDKELVTKPKSFFRDALDRFAKNKGSIFAAIVIGILVLYAIIAPIFSQYTVSFRDDRYIAALPKNPLFAETNFWDGCSKKEDVNFRSFTYYYAMGVETGHNAIKNQEYTTNASLDNLSKGSFSYRLDSYNKVGMVFKNVTTEQYEDIQAYQDRTGKQVIYPATDVTLRPTAMQNNNDANFWYKTVPYGSSNTDPVDYTVNADGTIDFVNIYVPHNGYDGETFDGYTSKVRIEGETPLYNYAEKMQGEQYKIRVNYYEYFVYYHTSVEKDGITEPWFLFGTTYYGQDIFTSLASGARFSFVLAIVVASVNLFIGAIYGAIEGYYGGKVDLVMERITEILSAVPFMIVITLLKYHYNSTPHFLLLFISYFLTGWIGMAATVRMQFYRFKNQEYVLASRTLGAKDLRIMFKHIFPNSLGTIVTSCVLVIPGMIFSETSLSYLGIINLSTGNMTSVGTLLAGGQPYLTSYPHIIVFPAIFISLLMLSFNLFGNGLRDAFNPSLRGVEE